MNIHKKQIVGGARNPDTGHITIHIIPLDGWNVNFNKMIEQINELISMPSFKEQVHADRDTIKAQVAKQMAKITHKALEN